MRELDSIVSRYEFLKNEETHCVLATVVHVEGSSYRRAGARMIVDEFGNITGAISGGCLEGDALRKALNALNQGRNKLVTYDTTKEEDAVIGAQLGCNGIIEVLFEPIDYDDDLNPCELLKEVSRSKDPLGLIILFSFDRNHEQPGTKLLVGRQGLIAGEIDNSEIKDILFNHSEFVFEKNQSGFAEITVDSSKICAFIQYCPPPVQLVIVGAGNDAQILARQADILGWKVVVTDGRSSHANESRFGSSCQIIVSKPEETLDNISIDGRSYFVLMSHNYNYDLAVLKLLIYNETIPYIGILGPKKKFTRMVDELKSEGIEIMTSVLNKIHSPVGLQLGAETPAEIGLSILSEIQSVITNTNARFLKDKDGPIHDSVENHFNTVKI
ncbi:XdhC family protein [Marinigracilibium pacificum]|uniref:XdhC family protein n=1 Tax=Marinigracilibium pacificum TaxID=2729599 RepID=A0A848IUX4_9BACT|nr:XdhC/CoxI family protein [Marinigracilibium pacificum]NMM48303.1 XdhC family protein [Marinigracilibium pacificum]